MEFGITIPSGLRQPAALIEQISDRAPRRPIGYHACLHELFLFVKGRLACMIIVLVIWLVLRNGGFMIQGLFLNGTFSGRKYDHTFLYQTVRRNIGK